MPIVNKLSVQNFRSHKSISVDLSPTTTIITGKNGAGKTSLIEAIYIALQGKSFKGVDTDVLQHQKTWWKISLQMFDGTTRNVTYDSQKLQNKKTFIIDGKTNYRLPRAKQYPIVLFEPDDLRLLQGSPSRRRQFIDKLITQVNPYYGTVIRKYERALKQRNILLKNSSLSNNDLFVWNIALSKYGAYIIEQRELLIEKINQQLPIIYNSITKSTDKTAVHYSHTLIDNSTQKLLHELEKNIQKDKLIGYTSIGPHRHDVLFYYNNSPAIITASRGEIRSVILTLKLIEIEIIKNITNINPLVLLDDVFSELDESRQKFLVYNNRESQTIITTTNFSKSNIKTNFLEIKL